jgi:hypothetical protein
MDEVVSGIALVQQLFTGQIELRELVIQVLLAILAFRPSPTEFQIVTDKFVSFESLMSHELLERFLVRSFDE